MRIERMKEKYSAFDKKAVLFMNIFIREVMALTRETTRRKRALVLAIFYNIEKRRSSYDNFPPDSNRLFIYTRLSIG